MKNFIAIAVCLFVFPLIATGCVNRQRNPAGVETDIAGSSQAVPSLPAACQGQQPTRENLMNGGSQLLAVKCSCAQNNRQYIWYNAVLMGSDPSDYCHPNFPVFEEPVGQNSGDVPLPVLSSSPAPPPPLPTASAAKSAEPLAKQAIYAKEVKYECHNGVAQRDYFLVIENRGHRTEQAIHQQCVGAGIECLTDEADQKNPEKPPCACPEAMHPEKISKQFNTWSCKASQPTK